MLINDTKLLIEWLKKRGELDRVVNQDLVEQFQDRKE